MPTYEYECLEEGHRFEAVQKISADPLKKCEVCGGKVKRLISAANFVLKGGGWYRDGYSGSSSKNGDGKKTEASEKKAESSSGTTESSQKDSSKTETKPTPKPKENV